MTCPICLSVDDAPLVAGLRAGALVLVIVASIILSAAARFAWRLWKTENRNGRSLLPERSTGGNHSPDTLH